MIEASENCVSQTQAISGLERAKWQRGEGVAVFTHLTDVYLSQLASNFIDSDFSLRLGAADEDLTVQEDARAIARLPELWKYDKSLGKVIPKLPKATRERIKAYTFNKTALGSMEEVVGTIANFPLNMLNIANYAAEKQGLPAIFENLQDIADIYRSDWFRDACEVGAFTANVYWEQYALRPVRLESDAMEMSLEDSKFNFDFTVGDNGRTIFAFSDVAQASLTAHLRKHNQHANDFNRGKEPAAPSLNDTFDHGTSGGCLGLFNQPRFSSKEQAAVCLDGLATAFTTTSEQFTAPREKTPIDVGLDFMADLFERAYRIKMKQPTAKSNNAPSNK